MTQQQAIKPVLMKTQLLNIWIGICFFNWNILVETNYKFTRGTGIKHLHILSTHFVICPLGIVGTSHSNVTDVLVMFVTRISDNPVGAIESVVTKIGRLSVQLPLLPLMVQADT